MRVLPAPPPDTATEARWAAKGIWHRLGAVLIASAVMVGALFLGPSVEALFSGMGATDLIGEAWLVIVVLVLAQLLAGLRNIALRWRGALASFAMMLPVLILSTLDGGAVQLPKVTTVLSLASVVLLIGIAEEAYGRGLLVTLLGGRRHAALAIIGSSIGFAYLHMPTYVRGGFGWRGALVLSTASAAWSCTGAIVRLRTGSIVGLIAFHALDDWRSQVVEVGGATALVNREPSLRVIVIGCIFSTVYWLFCRRAIREP